LRKSNPEKKVKKYSYSTVHADRLKYGTVKSREDANVAVMV
jgi:hypothetical protein